MKEGHHPDPQSFVLFWSLCDQRERGSAVEVGLQGFCICS